MSNVITSGTTLRVPNFQNHTTCVHVFGRVCVEFPANLKWDASDTNQSPTPQGLNLKITQNAPLHIGSPYGRLKITTKTKASLVITSGIEVRTLSAHFMLASNAIQTDAQNQYHALCLAYLNGKTVGDIAKRPDAIFSNADPKKRDTAINVMKEHGFYNCLKIMRALV